MGCHGNRRRDPRLAGGRRLGDLERFGNRARAGPHRPTWRRNDRLLGHRPTPARCAPRSCSPSSSSWSASPSGGTSGSSRSHVAASWCRSCGSRRRRRTCARSYCSAASCAPRQPGTGRGSPGRPRHRPALTRMSSIQAGRRRGVPHTHPSVVWRRGLRAIGRLPASRVGRILALAVGAGTFGSLTFTSSPLFALLLLGCIFFLGLESIEALSQEVDRADLTDSIPLDRGGSTPTTSSRPPSCWWSSASSAHSPRRCSIPTTRSPRSPSWCRSRGAERSDRSSPPSTTHPPRRVPRRRR